MKKILAVVTMMLMVGIGYAGPGPGPLFSTDITPNSITITPTAQHYYPSMGIRITTPGVTVGGCIPHSNGYCLFDASNTAPRTLTLTGSPGSVQGIICLNGQAELSCQRFSQNSMGTCQTGSPSRCGVFVRSAVQNGAMGGLTGANALCQATATANTFPGVWRAWLSTNTVNASTNILYNSSVSYVRATDISTVVAPPGTLLSGSLTAAPLTETAGVPVPNQMFTGTLFNGTNSGINCISWTSSAGGVTGTYGVSVSGSIDWTQNFTIGCGSLIHLYCFEVPT
ncbi:MAG: DUF1554 domain-containing protein [Legionella sp.]|nr:DUF1554 domain-containing protein [Legionella sp.]